MILMTFNILTRLVRPSKMNMPYNCNVQNLVRLEIIIKFCFCGQLKALPCQIIIKWQLESCERKAKSLSVSPPFVSNITVSRLIC